VSKIVITGGAGFIGSELGHKLNLLGHEIVIIDNLSYGHKSNLEKSNSRLTNFFNLDARDPSIECAIKDADCVFHFAAIAPLPDNQKNSTSAIQNNVEGTANVLEISRKMGVKHFVLSSTSAVYENNYEKTLSEDLQVQPDLVYAVTKVCAEQITNAYSKCFGLPTTILRFFNVYGPHQDFQRQHPPLMGYVARELFLERVPMLHSNGEQRRDYVHVDDVCSLCTTVLMNEKAYSQTFNVCSGETASANEIYRICASQINSSIEPTYRTSEKLWDAYSDLFIGQYPKSRERIKRETEKYSCGSFQKAERLIGWKPSIKLEQGVRSTIDEMLPYIKESLVK